MAALDDEVRDLEAVVEAAGLDRFALIARSQGGAIAVRYAALHPERVVKLIVMGGFVRGRLKRGAASTPLDEVIAFCKLVEGGWGEVHSAFRQMWTRLAYPGATAEQHDAYNHLQRVSSSPQDAAQIVRMMWEYDATADLERVECPTLVLHNPRDGLVPFEEGRLIASMVKGALLEPFESLNHVPLPDEPAFEPMMKRIHEFPPTTRPNSTRARARWRQRASCARPDDAVDHQGSFGEVSAQLRFFIGASGPRAFILWRRPHAGRYPPWRQECQGRTVSSRLPQLP